ncbi:MAG: oligosaccharide flippase family protein [Eubacteriales bacterium]
MKRSKLFLTNAIILTLTALFIRIISIYFNVYLTNKVGTSGLGLFQLISSVYILAITIASSGISTATTRLVVEEFALNRISGVKKALKRCFSYSIIFGLLAAALLFLGAPYIGEYWLCDIRTIKSLKVLAIGLPVIAMSNVFYGYFTAVRRVTKNSIAHISEKLIEIIVIVYLLEFLMPSGIENACVAIVLGEVLAELCSFFIYLIIYLKDRKRYLYSNNNKTDLTKRMLKISLPIAGSAYLRNGLTSANQFLIPSGLRRYGLSSDEALSQYGMVHAMVFPVIYLPQTLLYAFAGLLIPELTEYHETNNVKNINRILNRVFKTTLLFAAGVVGSLICFSDVIGTMIYGEPQVTNFVNILAPLTILMYLDCVVDCVLTGLNQQVNSMCYNLIESIINTILIFVLIPIYGITGYLFLLFIGKSVNMTLSIIRLIKVTDFKFRFGSWLLVPVLNSLLTCYIIKLILRMTEPTTIWAIILFIAFIFLYLYFLKLTRCISKKIFLH